MSLPVDPNARVPRPGKSMWYTEEAIRRARTNIRTQAWAARAWERISEVAERWAKVPDAEILRLVPDRGAIFCSGRNGTPCCRAAWRCEVSEPERAFCSACGRAFPEGGKGSPFADEGHGFYHDGKWFAPVPVWNSFIVSMLGTYSYGSGGRTDNALLNLALAYAITGERRFGEKALAIFDALATLSPTTIGPLDIPEGQSREMGRMHAETCHVKRQRFVDVQAFDLIAGLEGMDAPSPTRGDGRTTVRRNIVDGMFCDYLLTEPGGPHYDLKDGNLTHLQNHELDGYRALLSVGLAASRPEFIAWSGRAYRAFFDNAIGRDGGYYENSEMYAYFSGTLFQDIAELFYRYDPGNYDAPEAYPSVEEMLGISNAFDHPRLVRLCLDYPELTRTCGRIPSYGNTNGLPGYWPPSGRQVMPSHWSLVERLYFRSENAETRKRAERLLLELSEGEAEKVRQGHWALFNASPGPKGDAEAAPPAESSFAGHKGVVVLRSGAGDRARALLFRGGANLLAQDDQLALFAYDKGRLMIEDVGYNLAGSHVHRGWGMRAISHATVTVNEDLPTLQGYAFLPSASLVSFEDMGAVKVAEYSAPLSRRHQGAREFRRALFFCDVDEETSYALDVFMVAGGRVHDYAVNGPRFLEGDAGTFSMEGIAPAAQPGTWTLAALGTMGGSEEANAPGKSWGERIGPNDRIQGVAAADGSPLPYGWGPPPGNGYAFVHDVKTARLDREASACWAFGDARDTHFSVRFPADPTATFISARGPDLRGQQQIHRLFLRRTGEDLTSVFCCLMEAFAGTRRTKGAAVLLRDAEAGNLAVRVDLGDGRQDFLLFSRCGRLKAEADGMPIAFEGRFGVVRVGGGRTALYLVEGTRLSCGAAHTGLAEAVFEARVAEVHPDAECLVLDRDLPAGMRLEGRLCRVGDAGGGLPYTHASAYRVVSAQGGRNARLRLLHGDFRLSCGTVMEVEEPDVVAVHAPLAFAWGIGNDGDKGEYRGKALRTADGGFRSRIVELLGFKKIRLESAEGLKNGDRVEIMDVGPGDRVTIPNSGCEELAVG